MSTRAGALPGKPQAVLGRAGLERRVALHLQHVAHELQVLLVVLDDQYAVLAYLETVNGKQ